MEQDTEVNDLDIFLEKSEYGTGQVYQLHRKLGGVFIDASFHDEQNVYRYRFVIPPPKHVKSELKWDESNFPYELETYKIGNREVTIKLYRAFDSTRSRTTFMHFLEDVIIEMEEKEAPSIIMESFKKIRKAINEVILSLATISQGHELSEDEKKAIDTFFGNGGIWGCDKYLEEDLHLALTEFLLGFIQNRSDLYEEIRNKETENRQVTLRQVGEEIIAEYTELFEKHNFKKGFIVS
jgi:hypothetical protein